MARTRINYVADAPDHSGLVLAGVILGLLVSAGIVFLILMFAGAGAGNSGAFPMFQNTFMPIVLWTYGTLAVVSLILVFIGKHTASLIFAWLPALLMYFSEDMMKIASLGGKVTASGPPAAFIEQCKAAGTVFLKPPSAPVKSVALDYSPRVRRNVETRYQLDGKGQIVHGGDFSVYPGLRETFDFYEDRNTWSHKTGASINRFDRSGPVAVTEFSADILVFDEVSDPEEMDKPVLRQGLIRHSLTVTDRRNGDRLATMVYWVDWVNRRACGANVEDAIEVETFILQAAGIPPVMTKAAKTKRESIL